MSSLRRNGRADTYISENERSLRRYFKPLHRFAAINITRSMVAKQLAAIRGERGPIAADRSRAHLQKFYSWAIAEGLAETNPVAGTNRTGSKSRDRVLTEQEIAAIWKALGDDDHGSICKLLMLTGARREEIGALARREINFTDKQIELPGSRTKNGLDHIIPLSRTALAILKGREHREGSDYVFGRGEGGFSGWSKSKERLEQKLPDLEPWVLHDFRRTLSTIMHERLGVPPHIVEAVINHVSGAKSGVAGVYNRALYLEEKRAALQKFADFIERLVAHQKTQPRRNEIAAVG
ncbi:integrase [Bradyrhizobium sp. USDA 4448]